MNSHVEMLTFCSVGCQVGTARTRRELEPLKPRDARVLRVSCEHSDGGRFRVHLTEEDWARVSASYERIFQDRYDLLTVESKEGLLSSEWLMRTARAERECNDLRNEVARLEATIHALARRKET